MGSQIPTSELFGRQFYLMFPTGATNKERMTVKMKTQNSLELSNTCVKKRQSNNYSCVCLKFSKIAHESFT